MPELHDLDEMLRLLRLPRIRSTWEEAVDRFPDNIAIEDDRREISYRELDAMANRFGHWAQSRRLKRGENIVSICVIHLHPALGGKIHNQQILPVLIASRR